MRMMTWSLSKAKAQLSEVVRCAQDQPQIIAIHDQDMAVVLSTEKYQALLKARPTFLQRMQAMPEGSLDVSRDLSSCREIDL